MLGTITLRAFAPSSTLMDQYRPCHRIHGGPLLGRRLSRAELEEALRLARQAGPTRLD